MEGEGGLRPGARWSGAAPPGAAGSVARGRQGGIAARGRAVPRRRRRYGLLLLLLDCCGWRGRSSFSHPSADEGHSSGSCGGGHAAGAERTEFELLNPDEGLSSGSGGSCSAAAEELASVRTEYAPVPDPGACVNARRFPLLSGVICRWGRLGHGRRYSLRSILLKLKLPRGTSPNMIAVSKRRRGSAGRYPALVWAPFRGSG